jgi:hypothetical protein
MANKVIKQFREINHKNHVYNVGDLYPAEGFEANEERVVLLSNPHPQMNGAVFLSELKETDENEQNSGEGEQDVDLSTLSKEELDKVNKPIIKIYLDKKEIQYPSNAAKDELIKLVLGEE